MAMKMKLNNTKSELKKSIAYHQRKAVRLELILNLSSEFANCSCAVGISLILIIKMLYKNNFYLYQMCSVEGFVF